MEVRVSCDEHEARVEVVDGFHARPEQARPGPWDTRGRGLVLVDALVDEWGVQELDSHGEGVGAEKVRIRVAGG
jgi:hypothetical protein